MSTASGKHPTRRDFLRTTATAASGLAWLAGCEDPPHPATTGDALAGSPGTDAGTAPDVPAPGQVDAAQAADVPATLVDFRELDPLLQGPVLLPGDAGYDAARLGYNTRFDGVEPLAIARCQSADDVAAAVTWARKHGVPVRVRSGGHSYAGYSLGADALVLDVRPLNGIDLDLAGHKVVVGGGVSIIDVQAALWPHDLALPTGSCPTVGMAGLTLGGGHGLLSRNFGLTCDVLLALDLVLASGAKVTCDTKQNTDLFWACRGGGGGNFGVVTSLTFAVAPVGKVTTFSLKWPWAAAAQVLDAWQRWAPQAPHALTANCHLFAGGKGGEDPTISVGGAFLGSETGLTSQVANLLALGAPPPAKQYVSSGAYGEIAKSWVDCDGVVSHCQLVGSSPEAEVKRGTNRHKSDYVTQLLPPAAIAVLLQAMEARAGFARKGGLLFDPYGGFLGSVAPDATAFVHRDPLFSLQYSASAWPEDPPASHAENLAWLHGVYAAMRPYASGQAYQNYIDADLPDWQVAYYGANYARLQEIKAAVDPTGFFSFPQAIG